MVSRWGAPPAVLGTAGGGLRLARPVAPHGSGLVSSSVLSDDMGIVAVEVKGTYKAWSFGLGGVGA